MKVAVKKSVLFSLLKKHLQENRTADNPVGNFVYQSSSSDPFGIDIDEDTPIQPSAHMANQLTIEKPPVDDEDYLPASKNELKNAASAIIEELPEGQLEYYYRNLHKLLDSALDKHDEKDFVNETYDISKKTKASDLEIFTESKPQIRQRRGGVRIDRAAREEELRRKELAGELPAVGTPERTEYDFGDVEGYAESENQEEFQNGYNLALEFGRVVDQYEAGEIDDQEFGKLRDDISDINKTGSIQFQAGFDSGVADDDRFHEYISIDIPSMSPEEREEARTGRERQLFPMDDKNPERGVDYDYQSFGEYLVMTDMTKEQREDRIVGFVVDTHLAVQRISKVLEDENTAAFQMYWSDPKAFKALDYKYASEVLKPVSNALGLSHLSGLSPERTKEKFKKIKKSEDRMLQILERAAGVKRIILKMMKLELGQNPTYKNDLEYVANFFNKTEKAIIDEIADIVAEDYATYAMQRRFSDLEKHRYIDNATTGAISTAFKNRYHGKENQEKLKARTDAIKKNTEIEKQRRDILAQIDTLKARKRRGRDIDEEKLAALEASLPELIDIAPPGDEMKFFDLSTGAQIARKTIVARITPEEFSQFKQEVLEVFNQRHRDDEGFYSMRDPNGDYIVFNEDEALGNFNITLDILEQEIKDRHGEGGLDEYDPGEDDGDINPPLDISSELSDEVEEVDDVTEAEARAIAAKKTLEKFEKNNDLSFLAPYFGYSGPSGLRQWSLKYPKRKYDMMIVKNEDTGDYPFVQAIDSIYMSIARDVANAIETVCIPAVKKRVDKGKAKKAVVKPPKKPGMPSQIKSPDDNVLLETLEMALTDIYEITDFFPEKSYADILVDDKELAESTGGIILRNIVGDILDTLMTELDIDLNEQIGDIIVDEVESLSGKTISDKDAQWLANYFTGLMKDITPQSNMPSKLVDVGIDTYEKYAEIEELARQTLKGIALQFGRKKRVDRRTGAVTYPDLKYKKKVDALIMATASDPDDTPAESSSKLKKLARAVDKSVVEMLNDYEQEDMFDDQRDALTADFNQALDDWEDTVQKETDEDIVKEALLRLIKR